MANYAWILAIVAYIDAITGNKVVESADTNISINNHEIDNADLKSAASNYYSGWTNPDGDNGYGVTGYGTLDKNYHAQGAYDNNHGYNRHDTNSAYGYTGGYHDNSNNYYSNYKNGLEYKPPVNNIAASVYSGNGGYGGYGGNGGLGSYLGYNNPYYNGANHLGYGYYKKPGYGGIYKSGITPSLVTGYRGYSRK